MPQSDSEKILVGIIWRQFEPALKMARAIIDACPVELWTEESFGRPIGKRMVHAIESLDYFLNDFDRYYFSDFNTSISAEYDGKDDRYLSRSDIRIYFELVTGKCEKAFSSLTDRQLQKYASIRSEFTYLDIILLQLRHLVLNTGRCHEVFAAHGITVPGWIGYREPEENS